MQIYCLGNQRVSLPAANRVAHKDRRPALGVLPPIQVNTARHATDLEVDVHGSRRLYDLKGVGGVIDPRESKRQTVGSSNGIEDFQAHVRPRFVPSFADFLKPRLRPWQHHRLLADDLESEAGGVVILDSRPRPYS